MAVRLDLDDSRHRGRVAGLRNLVIYWSRVAARATKTRITRFMGLPVFKQMTVRSWRITTRLFELLDAD